MATEILAVPEEHVNDVINVIRTGLQNINTPIHPAVREHLASWCGEMEEYYAPFEDD
jgi:hypothetical protein